MKEITPNNAWQVAIDHYGNQKALSEVLGVTRQAISKEMRTPERLMPAAWAAKLHRDSNGAVHVLVTRADLYSGIVR